MYLMYTPYTYYTPPYMPNEKRHDHLEHFFKILAGTQLAKYNYYQIFGLFYNSRVYNIVYCFSAEQWYRNILRVLYSII